MNVAGLIVGLGNPGKEYERTRHNLGFMAVDALMEAAARATGGGCDQLSGGKKKYDLWRCRITSTGNPWLVTKPQTFMNLSGEAVLAIASYYRIKPGAILVVHDELDIPLGRMKFKTGGGNAGHNGLKSITQLLGTPDFHRLRLGIGRSPHGGETTNWVLGRLSGPEQTLLDALLPAAVQAMITFASQGAAAATQFANAYKPE
ncbi:aminoacyl-tRNA hydrolase [Nitratidesulfovibrio liaohensis]|uniref:Peptidyl-tRNA hydrolase n=1 Tax=Nitratidesulfovibrio liaohensis TaxID=2604158 RepID=A0ABY9R421_9BACT|nr:aminoacyl-tRNA hydrolase [Nitratidesulfovibrio liaohensis]WMW66061.1 aminoacyl-tRNA hydrolase [Nitratidesulfovibrio liaohensis]